jgi:hypothetical protein
MDYRCEIYASRDNCNGKEFAVKFVDAGAFPDDRKIHEIVNINHFAIVAATDRFEDKWSFVALDHEEKGCVGERMFEFECQKDIWYWCELFTD